MNTKETGNKGENLACEYLVKKGFKIMGRNCVLFCGEIDIVAKKKGFLKRDKTIHFIEVKTSIGLDSRGFFPEQRVDWKKQNKYKILAETWLERNKYPQNYPCQVDIVAVSMGIEEPEIKYFENIVSE
jgi:putative endonuclease